MGKNHAQIPIIKVGCKYDFYKTNYGICIQKINVYLEHNEIKNPKEQKLKQDAKTKKQFKKVYVNYDSLKHRVI